MSFQAKRYARERSSDSNPKSEATAVTETLDAAVRKSVPTQYVLPGTLVQLYEEAPKEGIPRYAWDIALKNGAKQQRREQLLRVEKIRSGWSVWTSVVCLAEHQWFSFRDLPRSYSVTSEHDLPEQVWIAPNNKPTFLTVQYKTNGKLITEPRVYLDSPSFRLDTFKAADAAFMLNLKHGKMPEEFDDRTRVVHEVRELANLKLKEPLTVGYAHIMTGRNIVLSALARQAGIPIGTILHWGNKVACAVQDPDAPGAYTIPLGKQGETVIEYDKDVLLPTNTTAPGRRRFDAVNAMRFEYHLRGRDDKLGKARMQDIARSHNVRNFGETSLRYKQFYTVR